MKYLLVALIALMLINCSPEEIFSDHARHDYWLLHEGAKLPIIVEGNTNSMIFLILLHGGPGGSAQEFNASSKAFTDNLENDYALVYYDQRNSGLARGEWDEEKLTIEQHIEDLDKVLELLKHKYGADIKLFLAGHSWGSYLATAYLFDATQQSKVNSFININGAIHRNLRNAHNLKTINEIADEQIPISSNADAWSNLKNDVQEEIDKNIEIYDAKTESIPNTLKSKASDLILSDNLLDQNLNGIGASIYNDNYDPFLMLSNERKGTLIEQMYLFDNTVETSLQNLNLPVLCIYGKYDVTTSLYQGIYLQDNISTIEADKKIVILEKSGHSTMKNEPILLAEEIKEWIENYK